MTRPVPDCSDVAGVLDVLVVGGGGGTSPADDDPVVLPAAVVEEAKVVEATENVEVKVPHAIGVGGGGGDSGGFSYFGSRMALGGGNDGENSGENGNTGGNGGGGGSKETVTVLVEV